MHLQVYIDTNVYLDLLATKAAITPEMSKLLALSENGSIYVHLPQQTEEEYLSNREDVIANTIKELRKAGAVGNFPPLVDGHEAGEEARHLRRKLAEKIQSVEAWYTDAAHKNELPFDKWFAQIRAGSLMISSSVDLRVKAGHRAAAHLPPGKGEELGDRLIWECLLQAGDFCEDLHLVTKDHKDYVSPLNPLEPRPKLQKEWADANWGDVFVYSSIEDFLSRAGVTKSFARVAEIGRAIWTLRNQSDDASIDAACASISRLMAQLSARQAKLIASAARSYYDRVFITTDGFDGAIGEFWRLYAKHLDKKEQELVSQMVTSSGVAPYSTTKAAANSN